MESSNRKLLIAMAALVVVALVVAGLAIGGVFAGNGTKTKTVIQAPPTAPATPAPDPSGGSYSSTFKTAFVDSCTKSRRLTQSQCRCIIAKAESAYSFQEFVSAVAQAQKGKTQPKLRQIFVSCASA